MKLLHSFTETMLQFSLPWKAWLLILFSLNMIAPCFFWDTLEARVVLGATLPGAGLMMYLFHRLGFVRLLGLGHTLWIPLIPWLFTRLDHIYINTFFGAWIVSLLIFNSVSLVIDFIDIARYIKGERKPYLSQPK